MTNFTPAELRKLRSLKDPYGIQRYLDDMPYHLADTGWSPRRVLRENTSHCFEGAIFAAAALRVNGFLPLILDLEAEHDTDHVIAIYRMNGHWGAVAKSNYTGMPLPRAGLPFPARTGTQLLRRIFQSSPRTHTAHFFQACESQAL